MVGIGKVIDISGQVFGKLTALEPVKIDGKTLWRCSCECGKEAFFNTSALRHGNNKSCGCMARSYLEGQRFERLTVVKELDRRIDGGIAWECMCDCGNTVVTNSKSLKNGNTKSCGCLQKDKARINVIKNHPGRVDHTGKRFGRWTVLRVSPTPVGENTRWVCKCDCGTVTDVITQSLVNGRSTSCGCAHIDQLKSQVGELNPNYKPHLSDEDRISHRYVLYGGSIARWRRKVYERDYWTCQVCHVKGGDIVAHHKNAWNAYPDERFDVDNGVVLCGKCHTDFHKSYGYGDNTEEQFEQFKIKNKQTATV